MDVSPLLDRFIVLHSDGNLEEAALTLERVIEMLGQEKSRRRIYRQQGHGDKNGRLSDAENKYHNEYLQEVVEHQEEQKEAFMIAGVMNDLGCTLQQVG